MKRFSLMLLLMGLLLGACIPPKPTATLPPTHPVTQAPTRTPSNTPLPTVTTPPVKTGTPTETPTATLWPAVPFDLADTRVGTPLPPTAEPITMGNIQNLSMLAQWGQGVLADVAYSPDGHWLAVATTVGVAMYDTQDLTHRQYFLDTVSNVKTAVFSPDSQLLAVASILSSRIQIWRLADQTLVQEFELPGVADYWYDPINISFSPDGQYFAASHSKGEDVYEFKLWQTHDWSLVQAQSSFDCFDFSPDGQSIVVSDSIQSEILIYRISDWTLTARQKIQDDWRTPTFMSVIYSEDGQKVIASPYKQTLQVFDATDLTPLYHLGVEYMINTVGLDRITHKTCDAALIDSCRGLYTPRIISTEALRRVPAHNAIAALYRGDIDWQIQLYSLEDGSPLHQYDATGATGFDFSPDGRFLAISHDDTGTVDIWDTQAEQLVSTLTAFNSPVKALQFSSNGAWLATTNGAAMTFIRRMQDGAVLRGIAGVVGFSPSGEQIMTGLPNGQVTVEAISGAQPGGLVTETGALEAVAYSHNGQLVFSSTSECNLRVRQASDGSLVRTLEPPRISDEIVSSPVRVPVTRLLSSPDGQYLFGSDEFGTLTIWNLADGSQVRLNTVPTEQGGLFRSPLSMALSPDGQTLAFADLESIVLYSPARQQILAMIPTPQSGAQAPFDITPVAFSPDGSLLVVGVSDGSLYVLNAQTLEIIRRFQAHDNPGDLLALAFSPDGRLLATSSQDGTIRLWGIR